MPQRPIIELSSRREGSPFIVWVVNVRSSYLSLYKLCKTSTKVGMIYLIANPSNTLVLALAFLTKKGFVHRDISPGNIIIYEGRAKLSDLEFAKQYESGASNHIRTVSQPPPKIWFFLWFSAVGYLRFHSGWSGSWCIYEPAIYGLFFAQPPTWPWISLVGRRLVSIMPLLAKQASRHYRPTPYQSCQAVWRDFIQQPHWPPQSPSRSLWLSSTCRHWATIIFQGCPAPYPSTRGLQSPTCYALPSLQTNNTSESRSVVLQSRFALQI